MTGYKFDTLSLHAGQEPDATHGSRAVPIHQTTSYMFQGTEHASALFNMEQGGHIYSRLTNPTVAALEQRIAALEGGVAAVAVSSGMAALFLTVLALASKDDHIVASSQMYGANINLFQHTLARYGITTSFVAPNDTAAIGKAIKPNTKMVLGEVIGNPGMDVMDVPAVAEVTKAAGVPLVVDGTFNTPWLFRPIDHGANIVLHSLTKWMGGHGTALAGGSSTAAISTGAPPAASRRSPSRISPSRTSTSGRSSAPRRSRPGSGPRACTISGPAWRR